MNNIKFNMIGEEVNIDEPRLIYLIIENKIMFYKFNKYCFEDFYGVDNYLSYFINDVSEKNDKVMNFIPNVFDLSLNNKRNINSLYKILKNKYYDDLKVDIDSLKEKAIEIISNIALDFDVELTANSEIKADDLFKILDLRFNDESNNLLDILIKYCSVIRELQNIDVFVINQLRDYFYDDDLSRMYHELSYKGITIIDVENNANFVKNKDDIVLIVDKDLCSIV